MAMDSAGNRLTPRQYQARWMQTYNRLLDETATVGARAGSSTTTAPAADCLGGEVVPLDGEWSLPGPRSLIDANPSALDQPHHDYPAWDWLIPVGTPIYAVRGGRVAVVRTWPYNWWNRGCGSEGGNGCDTCGIGVTIIDEQGTHWAYCHGSALMVQLGDTVRAGQEIMRSGNTGRSGPPPPPGDSGRRSTTLPAAVATPALLARRRSCTDLAIRERVLPALDVDS